jgi:hypothetical protein
VEGNASDLHVLVNTSFSAATQIEVQFKPGVALEAERLPLMQGDVSRNLRILRTSCTDGQIEMTVEGRPGQIYKVRAYTPLKLTANGGVSSIKDRDNYKTIELVPPVDTRLVDKARLCVLAGARESRTIVRALLWWSRMTGKRRKTTYLGSQLARSPEDSPVPRFWRKILAKLAPVAGALA